MGMFDEEDPAAEWGEEAAPTIGEEWGEEAAPTIAEPSRDADTAPHDLSAMAARLRRVDTRDEGIRLAYSEGQEDALRSLYVVMRQKGLSRAEMDHIALAVRQGLARL